MSLNCRPLWYRVSGKTRRALMQYQLTVHHHKFDAPDDLPDAKSEPRYPTLEEIDREMRTKPHPVRKVS